MTHSKYNRVSTKPKAAERPIKIIKRDNSEIAPVYTSTGGEVARVRMGPISRYIQTKEQALLMLGGSND